MRQKTSFSMFGFGNDEVNFLPPPIKMGGHFDRP